jgi:hypothetical protein
MILREGPGLVSLKEVVILRASISISIGLLVTLKEVVQILAGRCLTDSLMIRQTWSSIPGSKGKGTLKTYFCWWLTTSKNCNVTTYLGAWQCALACSIRRIVDVCSHAADNIRAESNISAALTIITKLCGKIEDGAKELKTGRRWHLRLQQGQHLSSQTQRR